MNDAWNQASAGVRLILWSGLTSWDVAHLRFMPSDVNDVEATNASIHPTLGRLLRWIAFSVGVEYLVKGICLLHGKPIAKDVSVVQPPSGQTFDEWVHLVATKDSSVFAVQQSYGTLGAIVRHAAAIPSDPADRELVNAALRFLASSIRNRDAHKYEENVRLLHFWVVPKLVVPALNLLLASVDQRRLATCTDMSK